MSFPFVRENAGDDDDDIEAPETVDEPCAHGESADPDMSITRWNSNPAKTKAPNGYTDIHRLYVPLLHVDNL